VIQESLGLLEEERWPEALSAARRAEGVLAGVGADSALHQQARTLVEDLKMARRLQEATLEGAAVKDQSLDDEAIDAAYSLAFLEYGLDVDRLGPQAAADLIRVRPIHRQLVAALDDWAGVRRRLKVESWRQRLTLARAADPDILRNRLRDFLETGTQDGKTLEELVAAQPPSEWPLPTIELLASVARWIKGAGTERTATLLGQARQRHPDSFWINVTLGRLAYNSVPRRLGEAIRFYNVAVALRPQSVGVRFYLGDALIDSGRIDEGIAEGRAAFALDPKSAGARYKFARIHYLLALTLARKRQFDDAIGEYRAAISLYPKYHQAHLNLGNLLSQKGQLDDAIAEYREAISIVKEDWPLAQRNLTNALEYKKAAEKLPNILNGEAEPADAADSLALAGFCGLRFKALYVTSVRFYRQAFAENPLLAVDLNLEEHRYNAAWTAALAGCGKGKDADKLDAKELAGLRDQALVWLRADLEAYKQILENPVNCWDEAILERMQHWLQDKDFDGTRGPEALGRLPEAEREGWRQLWVDVADMMRQAAAQPKRRKATEEKLANVLKGNAQPADAAECVMLAFLCQQPSKVLNAAAVRFYRQAFTEKPPLADNLDLQHRYNAACAAALAGCGQGKDADKLDAKERTDLREQALDWLRADLIAYRQMLEKSAARSSPLVAERMRHWLQDTDFAGVRGPEALARLPEVEREAWRQLWADVADLLRQARGKTAPENNGE
jgi:serine/threonine-protein kinase